MSSSRTSLRPSWLWMFALILLVGSVFVIGCRGPRVVLVPEGEPVQLAEPVEAHVYVNDGGQRVKSRNRVTLPEGWWALPDTEEAP